MERHWIHIMSNRRDGTRYVGVTGDIRRRVAEHQSDQCDFTCKYRLHRLVYMEPHETILAAIQREKNIALTASLVGARALGAQERRPPNAGGKRGRHTNR